MWNGAAEILKAMPAATKTMPKMVPLEPPATTARAMASKWVEPAKP